MENKWMLWVTIADVKVFSTPCPIATVKIADLKYPIDLRQRASQKWRDGAEKAEKMNAVGREGCFCQKMKGVRREGWFCENMNRFEREGRLCEKKNAIGRERSPGGRMRSGEKEDSVRR
jgi:hypothetical protein